MTIETKQITLSDDGTVFFQADVSNPLPGEKVATLTKGAEMMRPALEASDETTAAVYAKVDEVLEVLVGLKSTEGLAEPVAAICGGLYDGLGIVAREAYEAQIAALDVDLRSALRAKGVRLGPILLFCPALNKPAAVRMRALLWSLWNEKPLPANVPADGSVSVKVEGGDQAFYRAISYPLYGGRAIRIDMLDRVVNAVYEKAEGGKFRAQHGMCEWLGCGAEDLYKVLADMGHKKIDVPALAEGETRELGADNKPLLDEFYLKKGKAFQSSSSVAGPQEKKKPKVKSKRPAKKKSQKSSGPRVVSAGPDKPNLENSPFAILQQLKDKS